MDATHKPEEWRPVVGFEGAYEVSSLGRIQSLDRTYFNRTGHYVHRRGKILKPRMSGPRGKQYYQVALTDGVRGKIHHLVAEAFIGPRPSGMHVCHNDGDRFNNRADNLRYGTPSENNHDIVKHGRHVNARKTRCPLGHELMHPNLVLDERPDRKCRSCNSGHAYVQRHPNADFTTEAHRYYMNYSRPEWAVT